MSAGLCCLRREVFNLDNGTDSNSAPVCIQVKNKGSMGDCRAHWSRNLEYSNNLGDESKFTSLVQVYI